MVPVGGVLDAATGEYEAVFAEVVAEQLDGDGEAVGGEAGRGGQGQGHRGAARVRVGHRPGGDARALPHRVQSKVRDGRAGHRLRGGAGQIDAAGARVLRHWSAGREIPAHINSDMALSDSELIFCNGGSQSIVFINLDNFASFRIIDEKPELQEMLPQAA